MVHELGLIFFVGGRVKTWKRRWFILTDNCLYYFEYTTVSRFCYYCVVKYIFSGVSIRGAQSCFWRVQELCRKIDCQKQDWAPLVYTMSCLRVILIPDAFWWFSPACRTRNHVESFLWRISASERWRNPGNLWVPKQTQKLMYNSMGLWKPHTFCYVSSCRTASSCTIPTIKGRWSRRVRQRQMGGWWRETTSSTGYQHPHQRRKKNGSNPLSRISFLFNIF